MTLRTWLACGVTTVMDMGGPFWNFAVREEAGRRTDAPRVLATGPLFSMIRDRPLELNDPPILKVSSREEVETLAKRQLARRPNYLKVWFVHTPQDDLTKQQEIVKVVGDAGNRAGIRLAVHATELVVAKSALRAGADILVHSVFEPVDEEFLRLAKERNVIYVPTLYVYQGYYDVLSRTWVPTDAERRLGDPQILEQLRNLGKLPGLELPDRLRRVPEMLRTAEQNLVRVWKSGITIALGTDAGNIGTMHGPCVFREMSLMVHSGLTPAQVLRCATTNGAMAAGMSEELGRVAKGYAADLVVLNSNPLKSIDNASDISHVIRSGRVFPAEKLLSNR